MVTLDTTMSLTDTSKTDFEPGLRVLVAVASCHSWSSGAAIDKMAGVKPRGHLLKLSERRGLIVKRRGWYLTDKGRRLIQRCGVESVKCRCGREFDRCAFRQANRRLCYKCTPLKKR